MSFIGQTNKSNENAGLYLLTICIVMLSLIVGQEIVNGIANSVLGFSLADIPKSADLNTVLSLLLIPFAFVFASLLLCVKHIHKRPILSAFTTRASFDWKRFFTSFTIWGVVLLLSLVIGILSGAPVDWNFNPSTFLVLTLISVFLIPIQTSAEELLFRGYLLQGFGRLFKRAWMAILLSGILFGLLHWANPEVALIGDVLLIYYVSTGVFLGLLTVFDDGMELAMGYHAINNIFASMILTNDWQAFHTDALLIDRSGPVFGWESWLTIILLQPLLLFAYAKIYKWKNLKEKLFTKI